MENNELASSQPGLAVDGVVTSAWILHRIAGAHPSAFPVPPPLKAGTKLITPRMNRGPRMKHVKGRLKRHGQWGNYVAWCYDDPRLICPVHRSQLKDGRYIAGRTPRDFPVERLVLSLAWKTHDMWGMGWRSIEGLRRAILQAWLASHPTFYEAWKNRPFVVPLWMEDEVLKPRNIIFVRR